MAKNSTLYTSLQYLNSTNHHIHHMYVVEKMSWKSFKLLSFPFSKILHATTTKMIKVNSALHLLPFDIF